MPPVRVAIVSDTHAMLDPRIAALVADCDIAVHAGDIGALEVLRELRPRSGNVIAVRGNNDEPRGWPAIDHTALATLPWETDIELPGGRLAVEHGHRAGTVAQRHARLRDKHAGARAVVYGHSHRLVIDRDARPWILNPGAAGRARTHGGPSCLVLTASARAWRIEAKRFEPLRARA
ncbi:MAG: metallophosphoesterase family protein [Chromatiales bacterium]|nr:metallophosphoesterase family protein [Chromatiales bacterium]